MKSLTSVLVASLALSASLSADALIIMPLNGDSGDIAKNLGTLPDGVISSEGRAKPIRVSPGIGDAGSAIKFTNEQTGRPGYYQSIDIPSDGMDNLTAFTITLWFKSDEADFNPNNPIGNNLVTRLLDTTSKSGDSAGIKLGLNKGKDGDQVFIYLSDGLNKAQNWFNFQPRPTTRDGNWTFLAVTFDASKEKARVRIFGGDDIIPTKMISGYHNFDSVNHTGDSSSNVISIGDGIQGFANSSSHLGLIDGIYVTDHAMELEEIEAIRQASLK